MKEAFSGFSGLSMPVGNNYEATRGELVSDVLSKAKPLIKKELSKIKKEGIDSVRSEIEDEIRKEILSKLDDMSSDNLRKLLASVPNPKDLDEKVSNVVSELRNLMADVGSIKRDLLEVYKNRHVGLANDIKTVRKLNKLSDFEDEIKRMKMGGMSIEGAVSSIDKRMNEMSSLVHKLSEFQDEKRWEARIVDAIDDMLPAMVPQLPQGQHGSQSYGGSSVPSTGLGVNNDFYFKTDGKFYKKVDGRWGQVGTIAGGGGGGSPLYIDASNGASQYGAISGTINGSNAVFTNSQSSYTAGSNLVWVNGAPTTAFSETTPGSGVITFTTPPQSGDVIIWSYSG